MMPRDRKRNQQKQVPWRWLSATESDQQQAHE
jgi:hypothetical protein